MALVSVVITAFYFGSCKNEEKFPDIGTNLASPIDASVSDDESTNGLGR